MKNKEHWRNESIETLENFKYGNPDTAPTNLVKRCLTLTKIPVGNFTATDLRIMIGQQFALQYLIPLAIEKLRDDIFLETDFFEGDLLKALLEVSISFWDGNKESWQQVNDLISGRQAEIAAKKIGMEHFYASKFSQL